MNHNNQSSSFETLFHHVLASMVKKTSSSLSTYQGSPTLPFSTRSISNHSNPPTLFALFIDDLFFLADRIVSCVIDPPLAQWMMMHPPPPFFFMPTHCTPKAMTRSITHLLSQLNSLITCNIVPIFKRNNK